jgi:predicted dehydrogenase
MGRWHGAAARRARAAIVAIVDRDAARAQALARRLGGCPTYDDVHALLDQTHVDVVHVCTPLESHGEILRAALRHDCHALVEKPLVATVGETEMVFEMARQRAKLVCPVHQFPFQRGVRRAVRWLNDMERVSHLEVTVCTAGAMQASPAQGERVLADILPHPLSLVRGICGAEPDGNRWTAHMPGSTELLAQATVGGTSVRFLLSLTARPTQCSARLLTGSGTIHLDLFHGYAFRERGHASRGGKVARPFALASRRFVAAGTNLLGRVVRREPAYPGLRELVHSFYTSVLGRSPPPISPSDALGVARGVEAILSAAR